MDTSANTAGESDPIDISRFPLSLINRLAPDIERVSNWVEEIRAENSDRDEAQIAEFICGRITNTCTMQGTALALPGAVPGLGTVAQVAMTGGTIGADLALLTRNQTYMVFSLGVLHGIRSREVLVQDTLICMGLWSGALTLGKDTAIRLGTKVVDANFRKRVPDAIFKAINRRVGTTIVTKYGTKRGAVAVGRLIPFGVGMAVGGGANFITMKAFGKHCRNYMSVKM